MLGAEQIRHEAHSCLLRIQGNMYIDVHIRFFGAYP